MVFFSWFSKYCSRKARKYYENATKKTTKRPYLPKKYELSVSNNHLSNSLAVRPHNAWCPPQPAWPLLSSLLPVTLEASSLAWGCCYWKAWQSDFLQLLELQLKYSVEQSQLKSLEVLMIVYLFVRIEEP